MRAYTLAVKRMATIAADVVSSIVSEILAQGEIDISHQQRIAYIIEGENAEHHIVDRAYRQESQQIEHSLTCRQHAQDIVESCDGNDKDGPYGSDKQPQVQRHTEGIERGMIVEMSPRLRINQLNGTIEYG